MALTLSPGLFLLTTLIGRINYHYNVRQSDTHVTLVGGNHAVDGGFSLTSDKCRYTINIDIETGPDGKLVLTYWEGGTHILQDSFGIIDGDERRDMFEELRKVLDGEVVF